MSADGVGEPDVVELHRDGTRRHLDGVGLLLDQRLEVEDLEDPLKTDQGAHDLHPGVGERGERRVQAGEQQCQHHDVARGELAAQRKPAAQPVDEGQGQRRDQRQRGDERELQHRGAHADVPDPAGADGELAGFLVGAAEELDQGGAGRGEPLGHLGAHGGVVLGSLAPQVGQLGTHPAGRDEEDRQQDHGQHGHQPGLAQHHHEGERQGHHVADHAGQRAGEGGLRADDVVVQPADQGAGAGAGEEGDGHFLDVVEHLGAQVHDHALADGGGQPTGHQPQPGLGHGHDGDEHREPDHDVGAGAWR